MTQIFVAFDQPRKKDGRTHRVKGRVIGWVSVQKRVNAIVIVHRDIVAVPLADLSLIRSRK